MAVDARDTLILPYRWAGAAGTVSVEVGTNEDPAALGCAEFARGFPYMRATITPQEVGYLNVMGWIQLTRWGAIGAEAEFAMDPYAPLRKIPHPFGFFGFSPTMFDAPHTDEPGEDEFTAHTFLGAIGGGLFDFEDEARSPQALAILGFRWGFRRQGGAISHWGPRPLGPEDWDAHLDYLAAEHPRWRFGPGFREDARGR